MFHIKPWVGIICLLVILISCTSTEEPEKEIIAPSVVTEAVPNDSDDPAIWINRQDPSKSLILGTDKDSMGGIYAFDLTGKLVKEKVVTGIGRPNNIDVEYGLELNGKKVDLAVFTERYKQALRIFSLPDMQPLDGGGIAVFVGEDSLTEANAPMGIGLYKKPGTDSIYAIVSRKFGPQDSTYLWQYHLFAVTDSTVGAQLVRRFGAFSGTAEIEAIAVDDELGYVYYSDEMAGIRKYYADPAKGNEELAFFGKNDFAEDQEGISILDKGDGKGYVIVSDQQANTFNVYPREGKGDEPHHHDRVEVLRLSTAESDGNEVSGLALGENFPNGIFVAMTEGGAFHIYDLKDLGL